MEVNLWVVLLATVIMFAVGAIWYTFLFSKAWGKIHGFDKLSKKEQEKMMKGMAQIYLLQLAVTVISAFTLTLFITVLPEFSFYAVAFFIWLGFVMPSEVSAVLFSRTEPSMKFNQIAIMTMESLVRIMLTAWVISLLV